MKQDQPPNIRQASIIASLGGRKKMLMLIVVGILVAGAVAFYFLQVRTSETHRYTYAHTETYTVPGNVPSSSLSFTRPVELLKLGEASGQVDFQQATANSGDQQLTVAYLSAVSTTEAFAYTPDQIEALKANFAHSDSKYYLAAASTLSQFLKDRLPANWQIKLDRPKAFTNQGIKDNAWTFDFSATNPKSKKGSLKGKALYAISGKNYYYFMIASVSDNWQANQKTWQQVLDSLLIDR